MKIEISSLLRISDIILPYRYTPNNTTRVRLNPDRFDGTWVSNRLTVLMLTISFVINMVQCLENNPPDTQCTRLMR